jgi:hypothetical protein
VCGDVGELVGGTAPEVSVDDDLGCHWPAERGDPLDVDGDVEPLAVDEHPVTVEHDQPPDHRRPRSARPAHPTQDRALRNICNHGLGCDTSALVQDSCTLRSTRSGWGMSTVNRPSGVVTEVSPSGLPLGLAG